MKIGSLVIPAPGCGTMDVNYGVGLVIGIHEHSRGLKGRKCYIVNWHHEHQWWDDEELIFIDEDRQLAGQE